MHPHSRRWLLAIATLAIVHAIAFMFYQRPGWATEWDDQVGYQRLGHVLATTGTFTRYPDTRPLVPETIRTPGYPMFVAAVYRLFGESHVAVAAAQALLFAGLTLVTFALTSRLSSERVGLAAAALTALFAPIPYYGALVLTEVLCTVLVTMALWTAVRAIQEPRLRNYLATGVLLGLATLTRPTFALFPVALIASVALAAAWRGTSRRLWRWSWTVAAFSIVLLPWLAYNAIYVHRLTISPAGGVGRATWEASWQGTWSGRVQADLTRLAGAHVNDSDAGLDDAVKRFAQGTGLPADPMLTYVHQWRDIRRIWETPTDPRERSIMRVAADDEYWRAGLANIRRDRLGHVIRRVTVGMLVLWIAEIPIRYNEINNVRPFVIRLIWLAQAGLFALALIGLAVLVNRGHVVEAAPLAALIAYITAVHLPMLAEARYSLPAKPAVLALAAIAVAELAHRILPQTGDYLP